METEFKGSCLCGNIHYQCTGNPIIMAHCYCVDCKKVSGTSHGSHLMFPAPAFTVSGELHSFEQAADSGNVITRHFCPNCASPIYSTNTGTEGVATIRASTLNNPELFTPQVVVYKGTAPSWSNIDPEIPSFDGMPTPDDMKKLLSKRAPT